MRSRFDAAYEHAVFVLAKLAEDGHPNDQFDQYAYDTMHSQGTKGFVAAGLGAAAGIAGLAMKNKGLAALGGIVGAAGLGMGLMGRHDANRYQNDAQYRQHVNTPGLFNSHNDVHFGKALGMSSGML